MYKTLKNQLISHLHAYKSNIAGNFALTAAVSLTVIAGATGAAIDFSNASSERQRLQDLTDSAALAAAASGEDDEEALRNIVTDIMTLQSKEHQTFDFDMTLKKNEVIVSATAKHETAIMGMFGYKNLPISAKSGASLPAQTSVHLSLVLDTTDSMDGPKLAALQDAAKELVSIVEKSKGSGSRMSVVPFGEYVNVGLGNRGADWMDVDDDSTVTPACYLTRVEKSRGNCRDEDETRYRDGVPYTHTREVCDVEYEDFEVEICPLPEDVEWFGCAGSRNEPLNIQAQASRTTRIPGAMDERCGTEILPLTNDFGEIEEVIDDLRTRGDTYLPTGLQWGWRTLTEGAPFAAPAKDDGVVRAIVFMTDGGNTMTQYDKHDTGDEAYHRSIEPEDDDYADESEKAKNRFAAICSGVKEDDIAIYTVAYSLDASAASASLDLQTCASSTGHAFTAENSKELKKAFKDIGKSLSKNVRLTF